MQLAVRGRMGVRLCRWLFIAAFSIGGRPASAAPAAPAAQARTLSAYEQQSIDEALKQVPGELETAPEGKIVESVHFVRLDIFEPRDPAPELLNVLHATTRENVIAREILLRRGDIYQQRLADETARNLRLLPQVSVVLLVPLRGSDADHVRVLVVTKDVWSLRLGWDLDFYQGKFTYLVLQPSETNVFGTTQQVAATVTLTPYVLGLTGGYVIPRLDGSHIAASLQGTAIMNCATGANEGGAGSFYYGQPLYSSSVHWSWATMAKVSDQIVRPLAGGQSAICSNPRANSTLFIVDKQSLSDGADVQSIRYVAVPNRYRERSLQGQVVLTRSFYTADKFDFSFGAEVEHKARSASGTSGLHTWQATYETDISGRPVGEPLTEPEEQPLTGNDATLALSKWNSLLQATQDTRVSPYAQLHAYSNRYLSTINYATLGLQEDLRIGHDVYLRLYPAFRPISTRNMLGLFTSASYTMPIQSGFFRGLAAGTFELAAPRKDPVRGHVTDIQQSKAYLQISAQLASPDLGLGRVITNLSILRRALRYQDSQLGLGGSNQLRGYLPNAFKGDDLLVVNTEFRSVPVQLFSVLAGLDLFYDMGDAPASLWKTRLHHGAGVGMRVLLPQFSRDVFRVDLGFPLRASDEGEIAFTAGFQQVFGAPAARPNALLTQ